MATISNKSFIHEFSAWVQTIGIIIAAIWGAYTFIFKEIVLPKSAPVNVSVDLQLKRIEVRDFKMRREYNKSLVAVEMTVSATNPSSRLVYLQPNIWIASAAIIRKMSKTPNFIQQINDSINKEDLNIKEKHAWSYSPIPEPVAVGRLFLNTQLKPNEKITRKIIFHVPRGLYDLIEVEIYVPTVAKKDIARLEWKFNEKQTNFSFME